MINAKLTLIQNELKAPKSQYNSFGKYNYRNCEDILEALKPLLLKHNCSLIISDEVVNIGERYYIKATISLTDNEDNSVIINTALAREEESKKGMDGSQVTGASSSYARKYALNGLFAIDDTKDSDTTNTGENKKGEQKQEEYKCLKCGTAINGARKGDKVIPAREVYKSTGGYCIKCAKENTNG